MTDVKFCHVMAAPEVPENIQKCLVEQPQRSGMYNWIHVFRGDVCTYSGLNDPEDYDVIQINMTPMDLPIIPELKRRLKGSSTKLVLNNDYVCERWGNWDVDPFYYESMQRLGDMVFATEPYQASHMIEGCKVIPHPTNTKAVKRMGTDYEENAASFIYHWWSGDTFLPFHTLRKVKRVFGVDKQKIYGYSRLGPNVTQMMRFDKIMWDEKVPLTGFPEYAELIQGDRFIFDPNPFHTYGRNGVEFACWKKPVVGSDRVFSYRKLFPDLCCDPYDQTTQMELFGKIAKGGEWLQEVLDTAYEEVEYFNYANSKERFLKALEEVSP